MNNVLYFLKKRCFLTLSWLVAHCGTFYFLAHFSREINYLSLTRINWKYDIGHKCRNINLFLYYDTSKERSWSPRFCCKERMVILALFLWEKNRSCAVDWYVYTVLTRPILKYVHRGNVTRQTSEQEHTEHMIMPTKRRALSCLPYVCSPAL